MRRSAAPVQKKVRRGANGAPASAETLRSEVQRLETEIDRIYVGLGKRQESGRAGAADLSELTSKLGELRELVLEKRRQLSQLERAAARERLLRPTPAAPPQKAAPAPQPARPVTARRSQRPARGEAATRSASAPPKQEPEADRLQLRKLEQGLADPDPEIRRAAVERLAELSSAGARRLLTSAVADPEERIQAAALNALARQSAPASAGLFRQYAQDRNPHLRLAALRGLARLDDPETNPRLIEALEDEHPLTRRTAATLLGWREAAAGLTPLILALRDDDEGVRAAAATALGGLSNDRAVLPLIRALGDPEEPVRLAALQSLHGLVGDEVDIAMDSKQYSESEIDVLKRWWRKARLEKALLPMEGAPELSQDRPESAVPDDAKQKKGADGAAAAAPSSRSAPRGKSEASRPAEAASAEQPAESTRSSRRSTAAKATPPSAPSAAAQKQSAKAAGAPVSPEAEPASDEMGLDSLLPAEFQQANEEMADLGALESSEAATDDADAEATESEDGFESPLDGLLSDLGARPSKDQGA